MYLCMYVYMQVCMHTCMYTLNSGVQLSKTVNFEYKIPLLTHSLVSKLIITDKSLYNLSLKRIESQRLPVNAKHEWLKYLPSSLLQQH